MDQRLSAVTVGVQDLGRARRFYEEGLGWKPGFTNEEIVFYQLNGLVLILWGRASLAEDGGVPDGPAGFSGIALAHNVESPEAVDALLARAVAAGARLTRPAHGADWGGYSGYFTDPEGHLWEVAFNPHWVITPDGNTRIGSDAPA